MPELILAYLLIPFGLVALTAGLFFFFNIFHMQRYAVRSTASRMLMLVYFLTLLIFLGMSAIYISLIDWSQPFLLSDLVPALGNSSGQVLDPSLR